MIDYSALSRVADSFKTRKVSDAVKSLKVRKAIKDNEDKDIADIQAALAADGIECTLEELEEARKKFQEDVADSQIKDDEDANHQEKPVDGSGTDVPAAKPEGPANDVTPPAEPTKKTYDSIKVKDSYKNLVKKIKDDLEGTETTGAAIDAALAEISEETPAEEVLSAVIEVLAETIDNLSEEAPAEPAPAEPADEDLDAQIEDCKKKLHELRLKKIASK